MLFFVHQFFVSNCIKQLEELLFLFLNYNNRFISRYVLYRFQKKINYTINNHYFKNNIKYKKQKSIQTSHFLKLNCQKKINKIKKLVKIYRKIAGDQVIK